MEDIAATPPGAAWKPEGPSWPWSPAGGELGLAGRRQAGVAAGLGVSGRAHGAFPSPAGVAGGGGGSNDFQWCFSQVKGAIDEDVAEGKKGVEGRAGGMTLEPRRAARGPLLRGFQPTAKGMLGVAARAGEKGCWKPLPASLFGAGFLHSGCRRSSRT